MFVYTILHADGHPPSSRFETCPCGIYVAAHEHVTYYHIYIYIYIHTYIRLPSISGLTNLSVTFSTEQYEWHASTLSPRFPYIRELVNRMNGGAMLAKRMEGWSRF